MSLIYVISMRMTCLGAEHPAVPWNGFAFGHAWRCGSIYTWGEESRLGWMVVVVITAVGCFPQGCLTYALLSPNLIQFVLTLKCKQLSLVTFIGNVSEKNPETLYLRSLVIMFICLDNMLCYNACRADSRQIHGLKQLMGFVLKGKEAFWWNEKSDSISFDKEEC